MDEEKVRRDNSTSEKMKFAFMANSLIVSIWEMQVDKCGLSKSTKSLILISVFFLSIRML